MSDHPKPGRRGGGEGAMTDLPAEVVPMHQRSSRFDAMATKDALQKAESRWLRKQRRCLAKEKKPVMVLTPYGRRKLITRNGGPR